MARITITTDVSAGKISRHIYGHFAEHLGRCIYDGIYVGEDSAIPNTRGMRNDVVEALKRIRVPNIRWPGGCFAEEYHWMDGIGPRDQRPTMVNTHWGRVIEDNAFGTHEFMDLCEQLGTDAYICGNLASGTVREMQQWVEYLTAEAGPMADLRTANGRDKPWRVPFWGVGNENWACGGHMRPEHYADLYRQYISFVRNFGDNKLYRIACGPYGDDLQWTETLMKQAGGKFHGMGMHYYCHSGRKKQLAVEGSEDDWYFLLHNANRMDDMLKAQVAVLDHHDPSGRTTLLVDEWGTWHEVEPDTNPGFLFQQNTIRDAVAASVTLDIFNRHCRRVYGANIAQTVNVLQAMILTEGEKMLLTPTYHVFEMYVPHQDATCLPCHVEAEMLGEGDTEVPRVSASASQAEDGSVHVTMTNLDVDTTADVSIALYGIDVSKVKARVLAGDALNSHNTFDQPNVVTPEDFEGVKQTQSGLDVEMPPRSVMSLNLQ